jgi:aldehyde dehydrogenase (NAD+)
MFEIKPYWQNYIDGAWVDGGAGRIDVTDPATGNVIAQHALADAGDVDRAVMAARRVHLSSVLTDMRPIERGRMVQAMGRFLTEHRERLAYLLSREQGKPIWESEIEIDGAALYFEYYGNQASTVEGRSIPLGSGYFDFTHYEPFGVSAQIIPWNYPLEMTARSLSAALATGNAVVIKTPEMTPLTNYIFAEAAEHVGFPKGTVNVLCGLGADAGAALSAHPMVNQIVFHRIGTNRRRNRISCGKKRCARAFWNWAANPPQSYTVMRTLEAFETDLRWGIYFNAGQVCSAMSRVIVHESRHAELIERAVKVASDLTVAPGETLKDMAQGMGSMVSHGQRDRALNMVKEAQDQGATLATGGSAPNTAGAFLNPTVMDVTPDMTIARDEVFGPVLSVMKFTQDDEAIEIANSTDYGLVSGVFTADLDRANRAAQKLRAGQVFVNEWYAGGVETPFGGYGKSGYGREKGREALWNYVQTKNIAMKIGR